MEGNEGQNFIWKIFPVFERGRLCVRGDPVAGQYTVWRFSIQGLFQDSVQLSLDTLGIYQMPLLGANLAPI